MKSTRFLLIVLGLLALGACSDTGQTGKSGQSAPTSNIVTPPSTQPSADLVNPDAVIGVSVLTMTNPFFVQLSDAMVAEGAKHNYKVIVTAGEHNVANQKNQVADFITQQVDAIVLCPCDSRAIGTSIAAANQVGIPVFTADIASLADDAEVVCHVATDNLGGGRLAGQTMVELLGGRGKVAIIDYPEVESVILRTQGFHEIVDKVPGIEVVGAWPGGGDQGKSFKAAEDILQSYPDLDAFFAINDPSGLGVARALDKAGKADRIKIIAFDAQPIGREAVKRGEMYATIVQYPERIGQETIRAIVRYMAAEKVEPQILIPCTVYRKADADADPTLSPGTSQPASEPAQPARNTSPPETTTTQPEQPEAAEAMAPQSDEEEPTLLERPLSYWTKQAIAGGGSPEDRRQTIEALALGLSDPQPRNRVAAADALGNFGPEARSAVPALVAQLDHVSAWVRVAAMDTLTGIGVDAVPALLDAYQNGNTSVRIRSGLVIGSIGPAAKDAIPAVQKALEDENPEIRARAAVLLAQIDPDAQPAATDPGAAPTEITSAVPPNAIPEITVDPSGDWPQFHGPHRDSLCGETGLLEQWPADGLKLLWQIDTLGRGYSTVSIAGGRLLTMGDRTPEGQDESQYLIALDLSTHNELWATRVGGPHTDGPRCTPAVDGERVYALGTDGNLVCADVATGEIRWQKSLPDDFGGQMMSIWKYSESPLVDGDKLLCTPGGPDAAMVALDKTTGELIWKCALPEMGEAGKDGAGYSSMIAAEIDGVPQYVQILGRGLVGVDAESGRFLWGCNSVANQIANIPTPVVRGNLVFASTAYDTGSTLVRVTRDGDTFQAEEVYQLTTKQFENHHGGMILLGDYVYGGSGTNKGEPVCVEFATGKIAWQAKPPQRGSAAVLYADGHLLFRFDRGLLAWVEATPEEFRLAGTFQALTTEGPAWAHPVIHQGRLYLRHNELLLCYDLRAD